MADLTGFDASQHEPTMDNAPLPAGTYVCSIVASEKRETKAGTGSYLLLEFDVMEGPHKGRKLWDRLNIWNPSQQASEIANRTLSAICTAVNLPVPGSSEALHNRPLALTVAIVNRKDTGEPTNRIKGYKASGAATGEPAPASNAPGATPWD